MKLGGRKVQQSRLLDALDAEAEEEGPSVSASPAQEAPAAVAPEIQQVEVPTVHKEE